MNTARSIDFISVSGVPEGDHAVVVADTITKASGRHTTPEQLESYSEWAGGPNLKRNLSILAVDQLGQPLGAAHITEFLGLDKTHINAVANTSEQPGVGGELVGQVLSYTQQKLGETACVTLDVHVRNKKAQHVFESYGFAPDAEQSDDSSFIRMVNNLNNQS